MAEAKFTKHFKYHLSEQLNMHFKDNELPIIAKPEHFVSSRGYGNLIDIGIVHEDSENKLVGIEIEVVSSAEQVHLNRSKFRDWVASSPNRSGGLLHLLCCASNISMKGIYKLLQDSYDDISKGYQFFYEFHAVEPDYRQTKKTATYLLEDDWAFDARLNALLRQVHGPNCVFH